MLFTNNTYGESSGSGVLTRNVVVSEVVGEVTEITVSVDAQPRGVGNNWVRLIIRAAAPDGTIYTLKETLNGDFTSVRKIHSLSVPVTEGVNGTWTFTMWDDDGDPAGIIHYESTVSVTSESVVVLAASLSPTTVAPGETSTLTVTRSGGEATTGIIYSETFESYAENAASFVAGWTAISNSPTIKTIDGSKRLQLTANAGQTQFSRVFPVGGQLTFDWGTSGPNLGGAVKSVSVNGVGIYVIYGNATEQRTVTVPDGGTVLFNLYTDEQAGCVIWVDNFSLSGTINTATDALTVTLSSSDTDVATVPPTVTILANQLTATATVTGVSAGTSNITATYSDVSDVEILTVLSSNQTYNEVGSSGITTSGQIVQTYDEISSGAISAGATANENAILQLRLSVSLDPTTINSNETSTLTVTRSGGGLTPSTVYSENFESYSNGDSLASTGWTLLSGISAVGSYGGSKGILRNAGSGGAQFQKVFSIGGTFSYNWANPDGNSTIYVAVNGTNIRSHGDGSGTNNVTVPDGGTVKFEYQIQDGDNIKSFVDNFSLTGNIDTSINPLTINLTSSNTDVATVPSTITILENELSTTTTVTGVSAGTSNITATYSDVSDVEILTVLSSNQTYNEVGSSGITTSGQIVQTYDEISSGSLLISGITLVQQSIRTYDEVGSGGTQLNGQNINTQQNLVSLTKFYKFVSKITRIYKNREL